ncbi:CDP-diacylglycerol--serine O-phosphatidyltransferase [Ohtaekwangia koreensis]|jgi:CDP-diacylglycerol--serine O-phosphatidyltransferase|uniref:CDP-diacylglycerol--serine O-phosphatidyltransferase n=1 Tax=Ohtaekwangia koreensis TaxID=688867 RepID=A0A1T5II44_9BACT|nr:CDP-diacylglycerol--serine O-phosphatidyltransferase [Ohtaekwangia koreensis]SKC38779.1 CDP-diacylglycerol---serine O-phosphatidyltransferase [Ohtaekwangia koreensis]
MIRHLPNFLTCCNLICGCLGIVFLLENRGVPAAYFVWAAGLFDYFDGFVARLLKVTSPIGKELDSLADVVSFGVLPALVMYKLIGEHSSSEALPYIGFSIAAFSALRLAIFNIDETQTDSFKGLNTPANTLFITSLPLLPASMGAWLYQDWVLVAITLIFSLLLVSRIEIFALKFKNFTWADNKIRFTFLLLAVLLLALFQITAIPFIILLYIGLSLGVKAFSK